MFNFFKILGKIGKISSAVSKLKDKTTRKDGIISLIETTLEIIESKTKTPIIKNEVIKMSAMDLADNIDASINT